MPELDENEVASRDIHDHGDVRGRGTRYREFLIGIGSADFERLAGVGVTPGRVIEEMQRTYAYMHASDMKSRARGDVGPSSAVEWAARSDDYVIWEANRVIAVMVPDPLGRPEMIVTRFDKPREPGPDRSVKRTCNKRSV
jgi:hypothetical protein